MAGGSRKRGMITDINVTPLVDIVLVLLIIFMLTANLIARQAIEVDLPTAATGTTPKQRTLAVTIAADGALYLDGQPTSGEALRAAVAAAVQQDRDTTVLIAGDKGTSHGRVVWLLDLVRALGVRSFAVQIDPLARIAPPPPAAPAAQEPPPR